MPVLDSFPNVLLLLFRTFLGETMFDVLDAEASTLYNVVRGVGRGGGRVGGGV